MLGQVAAAGAQHPGDLGPPHGHRMTAGHQVEGTVGEGQRRLVRVGHHGRAERVQQGRRLGHVRRPRLGGDHCPREAPGHARQHLAAPGLHVQRRRRVRQPRAEQPLVAPGRALLARPAVQPGEVPAVHRFLGRLGHQLLERSLHAVHPPSPITGPPLRSACPPDSAEGGGAGQSPVVPSSSSRRMSRWPLWRAVSSVRWSRIQRRSTCRPSRTGRFARSARSLAATSSR